MKNAAVVIGMFWAELMMALLVCCVGFFIWGLVRPSERRAALTAIRISAALAFALTLSLLALVY
jgi:hypothetical protein